MKTSWTLQMRRWGGNRLTLGRVVTRKETGAHYLIESTGLDLDTAGEWLRRVPIVKLQYLKRLEGVAGACVRTEKNKSGDRNGRTTQPRIIEIRAPHLDHRLF